MGALPANLNYQDIIQTYNQLYSQARQANEDRYGDILGQIQQTTDLVTQRYDDAEGLLQTLGQSDRERIDMGAHRAKASSDQDLISRGLGNTTVREAAERGVTDDQNRAHREVTEQVSAQRAGVLQNRASQEANLGNFMAQMMEARTDAYPDVGLFSQLIAQAGQAEGAAGGGGGSNTTFTGLSANARAGLDAFGQPFHYTGGGTTGSGGGSGGSYDGSFAGATTGGGSSGPAGNSRIGYSTDPVAIASRNAANQLSQNQGAAGGGSGYVSGAGGTTGVDDLFNMTSGTGVVSGGAAGGSSQVTAGGDIISDAGDTTGGVDITNMSEDEISNSLGLGGSGGGGSASSGSSGSGGNGSGQMIFMGADGTIHYGDRDKAYGPFGSSTAAHNFGKKIGIR